MFKTFVLRKCSYIFWWFCHISVPPSVITSHDQSFSFFFFFKIFKFIFREKGRVGERGKVTSMCERYIDRLPLACPQLGTWPATQAHALTGNRTSDLSVRRPELSPLSHTSQGAVLKVLIFEQGSCCLVLHWAPQIM